MMAHVVRISKIFVILFQMKCVLHAKGISGTMLYGHEGDCNNVRIMTKFLKR